MYRGAYKSLARPGRKQATVTEDFDVYLSYKVGYKEVKNTTSLGMSKVVLIKRHVSAYTCNTIQA
jgi:hypothetical protein